ncbi:MAG: hypothetical protein Kow0077_02910 [Anaerolineae bacterium]
MISRWAKLLGICGIVVLLLVIPGRSIQSQNLEACPQIVQVALDTTEQVCTQLGENEICYGHVLADASPHSDVEEFVFEDEGDIEDLVKLQAVRLSPMDVQVGTWGVVLINMQAYLEYAAPEEVTFVLFGDVELENATEPLTGMQGQVRANDFVNARLGPSTRSGVVEVLRPGQHLVVHGRVEDNSWVRVVLPQSGRIGWVDARFVAVDGPLEDLKVVDASEPYYGPMHAFYFRSGLQDAFCPESPESGLLVQTPEGVAEVTLLVNEVSITMQATAFLQAQPGNEMQVAVLDGWAEVRADGIEQPVFAGTQVRIPMPAARVPGEPLPPEPYDFTRVAALPTTILPTDIQPEQPLSLEEVNARLQAWRMRNQATYVTADDGTLMMVLPDGSLVPVEGGTPDDTRLPPGLDGVVPPGMGGTPPGQGGTPPGQEKKK